MTGILDRVAKSHARTSAQRQYRPATPEHFFALTLARLLQDAAAVHHYAELCDRHSQAALLEAYGRASSSGPKDMASAFHAALESNSADDGSIPAPDLAAIRIERRAIAVTIFRGTRLKYAPIVHQLASDGNKALGSAAMFIGRLPEKCAFSSAAIELLPDGCEAQRSQLTKIICEVLVQAQVAIHRFPKAEVLAAFGHPPLRFRNQVREVISAMWPEINGSFGSPLIRDALALGLHAQTERLFQE
jgi:hypothetical protein